MAALAPSTDTTKSKSAMERADEGLQAAEYTIDFAGSALKVAHVVVSVGKAIPIVGGVCGLCQEIIIGSKKVLGKLKDGVEMLRRIYDVAKFLESLPRVLEKMGPSSPQVSSLQQEIQDLFELLKQFKDCVVKFSSAKLLTLMLKSSSFVLTLTKGDKEIKRKLESIKEMYTVVRDEAMMSHLNELMKRQCSYPLESYARKIQGKVEETQHASNYSLTDDQAAKIVLEEVQTDPELQFQLADCALSSEGEAGLKQSVRELMSKVSEKVDQVLMDVKAVHKQIEGLGEQVTEVGAGVNQVLNILTTGRGVGGSGGGTTTESREPDVVFALHPDPVLIGNDPTGHRSGILFDKHLFSEQLSRHLTGDEEFKDRALSVLVAGTGKEIIRYGLNSPNLHCFCYLGVGIGHEAPEEAESQESVLMWNRPLPRVVVICLQHGARLAAERMSRLQTARNLHAIVWIEVDLQVQASNKFKVFLLDIVKEVVIRPQTETLKRLTERAQARFGECAGCLQGLDHTDTISLNPLPNGIPKVMPEERIAAKNNVFITLARNLRDWRGLDVESLRVLSCDLELVNELNNSLLSDHKKSLRFMIKPGRQGSVADSLISRHRGVCFEVMKRMLVKGHFDGIFRISSIEETTLKSILKCWAVNDFANLMHGAAGRVEVQSNDVMLWFDLQSEELVGRVDELIDVIGKMKETAVLITCSEGKGFEDLQAHPQCKDLLETKELATHLDFASALPPPCSFLHEELKISVNVVGRSSCWAKLIPQHLSLALQRVLNQNRPVAAVYVHDESTIIARISIPDVNALHFLSSKIIGEGTSIGAKVLEVLRHSFDSPIRLFSRDPTVEEAGAAESLDSRGDESMEDVYSHLQLTFDLTHFARRFESALLRLEDLTPHQQMKLDECEGFNRVHVKAPAGSGKTFLALHRMLNVILDSSGVLAGGTGASGGGGGSGGCGGRGETRNEGVLFVARSKALCAHFAKWLYIRLKQRCSGAYVNTKFVMESYFRVLFEPFEEGIRSFVLKNVSVGFEPIKQTVARSHALVVVDEAHHLYEMQPRHHAATLPFSSLSKMPSSLMVASDNKNTSFLHDIVAQHAPSKEAKPLMLLSDASQSHLEEMDDSFDTKEIRLLEVVRSSQRLASAARPFGVNDFQSKCPNASQGPPLLTYLFEPPSKPDQLAQQYAVHLQQAVHAVKAKFPDLSLDGRLAIVFPDAEFMTSHRRELKGALRLELANLKFVSAVEAAAMLPDPTSKPNKQRIIFDEISAMDGLERLVVIGVGLDSSSPDKEARSRLYRTITRAQLMFVIVNEDVRGGWLEWLLRTEYVEDFNETKEGDLLNVGAAASFVPSFVQAPTSLETSPRSKTSPALAINPIAASADDGTAVDPAGVGRGDVVVTAVESLGESARNEDVETADPLLSLAGLRQVALGPSGAAEEREEASVTAKETAATQYLVDSAFDSQSSADRARTTAPDLSSACSGRAPPQRRERIESADCRGEGDNLQSGATSKLRIIPRYTSVWDTSGNTVRRELAEEPDFMPLNDPAPAVEQLVSASQGHLNWSIDRPKMSWTHVDMVGPDQLMMEVKLSTVKCGFEFSRQAALGDLAVALGRRVVSLSFRGQKYVSGNIKSLVQCPGLATADFGDCESITGSFETFSLFRDLTFLAVKGTNIDCSSALEHLPKMSQIEILDLTSTNAEEQFSSFSVLHGLKSLTISRTKIDCSLAFQLLKSMPWAAQINTLGLAGTNVEGSFKFFMGLLAIQELDISSTKVDCSRALELISSAPWAPQIKTLGLAGTNAQGDIAALGNCTNLEKADFEYCRQITGDIAALGNCTNLMTANFYGCSSITGDIAVLGKCTNLVTANFNWCMKITGDIAALGNCTNLKNAYFMGCYNITGDIAALGNCTNLKSADFRYCQNITGDIAALGNCTNLKSAHFFLCHITGDKEAIKRALPACDFRF